MSNLASESSLSTNAQLNIYQHYNPTNLPLFADNRPEEDNGKKSGMTTWAPNFVPNRITIRLKGNLKSGVIDNVDEIVNFFVHEEVHVNDYRSGRTNSSNSENTSHDCRAIEIQKSHPSYAKTRKTFKDANEVYKEQNHCP